MSLLDFVRLVSERVSRLASQQKEQEASRKRKRTDTSADATSPVVPHPFAPMTRAVTGQATALMALGGSMMMPVAVAQQTAGVPALLHPSVFAPFPEWRTQVQQVISACNAANDRQNSQNQWLYGNRPPLRDYVALKKWMDEMDEVLVAHGGKTALELEPAEISEAQRKELLLNRIHDHRFYSYGGSLISASSFWRLGQNRQGSAIGTATTLSSLYTELFTACWDGDNAKIQELCLPQKASKNPDLPIAIAVRWGDNWKGDNTQYYVEPKKTNTLHRIQSPHHRVHEASLGHRALDSRCCNRTVRSQDSRRQTIRAASQLGIGYVPSESNSTTH